MWWGWVIESQYRRDVNPVQLVSMHPGEKVTVFIVMSRAIAALPGVAQLYVIHLARLFFQGRDIASICSTTDSSQINDR